MKLTKKLNSIHKRKYKLKSGDNVKIIAGNYSGSTGKIKKILTKQARVIVDGVGTLKKHVKPSTKTPYGGIIQKEASINISNVMLLDPKTNKITRVGKKRDSEGKLKRYSKKTGEFIS